MNCEFCSKTFSSLSSLNKHKSAAKYCLKIQGKEILKNNNEQSEKDIISCEYCKKTFCSNQSLQRHLNVCGAIDPKKELKTVEERHKEQMIMLEESYKEQLQIKDIEIAELKASLKIYKSSDECLKEIAKQPKNTTTNNTTKNNNNNNLLYMPTLNLDKDTIKTKIKNNFTESHLKDGQFGVAYFTVDNLLKDEDDNYMYICTDPSRQMFSFKNKNGIIEKDFKANKLTKLISEDVIKQATNLTDDKIESHIKLSEIREMKKDNTKFTSKLSNLLYKPGGIENETYFGFDSDFDSDHEPDIEPDIESDVEEYREKLNKINELDDGSIFFSIMRKQIEKKILEKESK